MFKGMLKPDLYHGRLPWNKFEGWYFKICDKNDLSFSLIPGVLMDKGDEHSFVQFLCGKDNLFSYFRLPYECFSASKKTFALTLDNNIFSFNGISLNLSNDEMQVEAKLDFSNSIKWNPDGNSHRSMGFLSLIPFMECYSQVCSIKMMVSGYITVNGKTYFINDGHGYIEKNWGNAFPYSWIWIQSNCFDTPDTALSASIAHIPVPFGSFRGFLIGFYYKGTFYSFTTMNRSELSIKRDIRDVKLIAENNDYQLMVETKSDRDSFILCRGPKAGKMVDMVRETLTAEVFVKLIQKSTGNIIVEANGHNSGIEYGGEQMMLLNQ